MEAEKYAERFGIKLEGNIVLKGKKEYLVPGTVQALADKIPLEPFSLGVPLGEVSDKGFKATFALLDLLKETKNHIIISDEAEWFFTCGRDVFMDKIVSEGELNPPFLVMNEHKEVLGLGRKEKDGKKEIIKNLFDRGDFLRREQKKKKGKSKKVR